MTTILLALILLPACMVLGTIQGMTMIQMKDEMHNKWTIEGVRGHDWFRHYHWILAVGYTLLLLLGAMLWGSRTDILNLGSLGVWFIGWDIYERAYSYSRYAAWVPESENVLGAGIRIYWTGQLMLLRLFSGVLLITISYLT